MDRKNIEAIFPLAPMQQALLVHSLQARGTDPGFLQLRCTLLGKLDFDAFAGAWQQVMDRHPALRASVHWKEIDRPLQIIHRRLKAPWLRQRWNVGALVEAQKPLDEYLRADREQGLDLSQAPVMRLALFQVRDDRTLFVWSCHHLLLDGWSGALVLREVSELYEAACDGRVLELPPARPYRDYVTWLNEQDLAEAEATWRDRLAGITPTPLPLAGVSDGAGSRVPVFHEQRIDLSVSETAALQSLARRHRVTLNTLLQGAWAALLGYFSDQEDVLFGATVSGRSADLPGIDAMVGLFINTLPVRVRVSPEASFVTVLKAIQERQAGLHRFEHVPVAQIQDWSGVPAHQRLFESLLVVENYPAHASEDEGTRSLLIRNFQGDITSNYPLTLLAAPGEALSLQAVYDSRRFEPAGVARVMRHLQGFLRKAAAGADRRLADLHAAAGEEGAGEAHAGIVQSRIDGSEASGRIVDAGYVAPRDPVELQLARIWERVLQTHPVGVCDDFFDLGGHSLLAVHLFAEVEKAFSRKLPLSLLFELSTIESLARALRDEDWAPSWSSLVPMQPSGSEPALFCMHSWDGQVLMYRDLSRRLAPDRPVYGLQAEGLAGDERLSRVEDIAAHFLREMRSVQPQGPYHLLGICFGAMTAFEIAQQLRAQGEEVAGLYIVDTRPFIVARKGSKGAGGFVRKSVRRARALKQRVVSVLRARTNGQHVATTVTESPYEDATPFDPALRRAWDAYEPRVYPGRITLIRSSEWASRKDKAWHVPAWRKLSTEGADTIVVPGEHASVLQEPHAQIVAERLRFASSAFS
jgi:thioesterase domain-containing protein